MLGEQRAGFEQEHVTTKLVVLVVPGAGTFMTETTDQSTTLLKHNI